MHNSPSERMEGWPSHHYLPLVRMEGWPSHHHFPLERMEGARPITILHTSIHHPLDRMERAAIPSPFPIRKNGGLAHPIIMSL